MLVTQILVVVLGLVCVVLGLNLLFTGRLKAVVTFLMEEQRPGTTRAIGVGLIALGAFAIWRALVS